MQNLTKSLSRVGTRSAYARIALPPWFSSLILLLILLAVNFYLQRNLFELRSINSNLRVFLPAMIVAVGQALVVLGGGIDLSVGNIASMVNAILVTLIVSDATPETIALGLGVGLLAGVLAGALNGMAIAYLRLQPIVTTYATSFIFGGIALWVLPRPGGLLPSVFTRVYRQTPLNIPFVLYVVVGIILLWWVIRRSRYGQSLYAVGSNERASYTTGIPVNRVRMTTYVLAGFLSALAGLALSMSTGTGDPNFGRAMTLPSIVAVVLGGIRLSGGRGSIVGALLGVLILGVIRNIISFAQVPTWWQTLVDALIILAALTGPGLVRLIRTRSFA